MEIYTLRRGEVNGAQIKIFMCDVIGRDARVEERTILMTQFAACILGSGGGLFHFPFRTSAESEGQGRKIRKSRGTSRGKDGNDGKEGVRFFGWKGGKETAVVNRTLKEDYHRVVLRARLLKYAASSTNARKVHRKMGK